LPPPPGTSTDLPPGYADQEQRSRQRSRQRTKSRIGILFGALILVVCVVVTLALTAENNAPQTLADIEVGQCFLGADLNDVEAVDCDQAHHGELVAVLPPTDANAAYPGEEALHTQQNEPCAVQVEQFFGGTRDILQQRGVQIYPVVPSESQWNDDITDTFCYVGASDPSRTITGSVEGLGAAATTTVPAAP